MIIEANNKRQIILSVLVPDDVDQLSIYLHQLSKETKMRFGPHQYDSNSIANFYTSSNAYIGFVAREINKQEIIAYSIVKIGFLDHDSFRLESYGLNLDSNSDCTFAPSVDDRWQKLGIGKKMFEFILSDLKTRKIKRVILWGGVQAANQNAIHYYLKNEFRILGEFEYNGNNYDMAFDIY
ncbi:MAG: GNAT family N-acetyltransferase [Bacteroidota bacterium]|jgi:diamine N-acetyltransferase